MRYINYEISESGVSPAAPRYGGVAGEHKNSALVLDISRIFNADENAEYAIEYIDGSGGMGMFTLSGGDIAVNTADAALTLLIPDSVTALGGVARFYLKKYTLDENDVETVVFVSNQMQVYFNASAVRSVAFDGYTRGIIGTLKRITASLSQRLKKPDTAAPARLPMFDGDREIVDSGIASSRVLLVPEDAHDGDIICFGSSQTTKNSRLNPSQLLKTTDFLTAENLADAAITDTKLADYSVGQDKLCSLSVTEDKICGGAVTVEKIEDGAVTADKLADNLKPKAWRLVERITIGYSISDDAVYTPNKLYYTKDENMRYHAYFNAGIEVPAEPVIYSAQSSTAIVTPGTAFVSGMTYYTRTDEGASSAVWVAAEENTTLSAFDPLPSGFYEYSAAGGNPTRTAEPGGAGYAFKGMRINATIQKGAATNNIKIIVSSQNSWIAWQQVSGAISTAGTRYCYSDTRLENGIWEACNSSAVTNIYNAATIYSGYPFAMRSKTETALPSVAGISVTGSTVGGADVNIPSGSVIEIWGLE